VLLAEISDEDKVKILSTNARRVYRPDGKTPGRFGEER